HLQGFRQGLAGFQGAQGGELDGHAVGHRVGERHAQFDHVGTGFWQALEDRQGGVVARVASGDEGDQRGAALGLQLGEALFKTAHACFSWAAMWFITVCMSLSPRPDRHTTIRWSLGRFGARLIASARAWELSRAGMMPSRRQVAWKASRASSSVMLTYSTRFTSCR